VGREAERRSLRRRDKDYQERKRDQTEFGQKAETAFKPGRTRKRLSVGGGEEIRATIRRREERRSQGGELYMTGGNGGRSKGGLVHTMERGP